MWRRVEVNDECHSSRRQERGCRPVLKPLPATKLSLHCESNEEEGSHQERQEAYQSCHLLP